MRPLPDPFALTAGQTPEFEPAARRRLELFGAPVELCWLPQRKERGGQPGRGRPPFRPAVAERILAEETLWSDGATALTPNLFPFAARHAILWSEYPTREARFELIEVAIGMTAQHGGTCLGNSIGAAASVQRAHVHLVPERLGWLPGLPTAPAPETAALIDAPEGLDVVALATVPFLAIGLRGPLALRARGAARLLEIRTTAAFNWLDDGTTTWVFPRGEETPRPHFPYPLGAAELWGRWCYGDEKPFAEARVEDLERALVDAGVCAR